MKKVYKETSMCKYILTSHSPGIPWIDLIIGVPKHEKNDKKYYKSTFFSIHHSIFITYVSNVIFGLVLTTLGIYIFSIDVIDDFWIWMAIFWLILSGMKIIVISQIKNVRRVRYYKNLEYSKFIKKHFIWVVFNTVVMQLLILIPAPTKDKTALVAEILTA